MSRIRRKKRSKSCHTKQWVFSAEESESNSTTWDRSELPLSTLLPSFQPCCNLHKKLKSPTERQTELRFWCRRHLVMKALGSEKWDTGASRRQRQQCKHQRFHSGSTSKTWPGRGGFRWRFPQGKGETTWRILSWRCSLAVTRISLGMSTLMGFSFFIYACLCHRLNIREEGGVFYFICFLFFSYLSGIKFRGISFSFGIEAEAAVKSVQKLKVSVT